MGNDCSYNTEYGINFAIFSPLTTVSGNTCNANTLSGIYNPLSFESDYVTITGNICSFNTEHGIFLYNGDNIVMTGNICNSNVRHGIYMREVTNSILVGNTCNGNDSGNTGTYDGICLEYNGDYNLIMCNTCNDNDRWGISIGSATCQGNWVKNNFLRGNTSGPFNDAGTDTVLAAKTFQFIAGGDVEGTAVWAKFISASASAKGWQVNGADDWAVALYQLPLEVQQVVRIKIWAVALGAPINPGGQMHLNVLINGGLSNLAYTSVTVGIVSFDGEEIDYVNADVVHWSIDATDDADVNNLVAGMSLECKVIYRAGDDPDGATNAVLRCVEIEYV